MPQRRCLRTAGLPVSAGTDHRFSLRGSVLLDDERATGRRRGPVTEAFLVAKFVRRIVLVGGGDRDRDGPDRVVLVCGLPALQADAIGLAIATHVLTQTLG